jgi:threonine aldolase
MDFSSDTSAPAHPAVIEAIAKANSGNAPSYGGDQLHAQLAERLEALLGTADFDFWLTASGTAANALALSVMCRPTGAVLCHEEAHIARDERGAPEFFTGGAKLSLLGGQGGQIDEAALRGALAAIDRDFVHETPAETLSLTQLTECGTAYSPARLAHFASLARDAGLNVHLDGARLANALASSREHLSALSWQAGIDVLTLGLTKTGAMGCEIILLFGDMRARLGELRARAKRSGHMPPKMRFLAAQALALLEGGLWLDLAGQANAAARQVSNILCARPGVELVYRVDGNEVFVRMPQDLADRLRAAGAVFYPWPGDCHRFVCAWTTGEGELDALRQVVG